MQIIARLQHYENVLNMSNEEMADVFEEYNKEH